MFLNKIRNKSFWIIDTVKGKHMKTHLKEVEFCIQNPSSSKAIDINTHLNDPLRIQNAIRR